MIVLRLGVVTVILLPGAMFGQAKASRVNIVTVCEVIENMSAYVDRTVAVVGRLQLQASFIDPHAFLVQDGCERPLVTAGRTWPSEMLIFDWGGEPDLPKPPSNRPRLDRTDVAAKLKLVRKTTALGYHKEFTFEHEADVPNEWAVLYGRIVSPRSIGKELQGSNGFLGAPLMIRVYRYNIHKLNGDGTPVADSGQGHR